MKKLISALVVTCAFATGAHAAQVVYVGSLEKSTGNYFDAIYSGVQMTNPSPFELARIQKVWNVAAQEYEQQFIWIGTHDGVVSTDALLQMASNNLCDIAKGHGCLVTEDGKMHSFFTKVQANGVKSIYAAKFIQPLSKAEAKFVAGVNKSGMPAIYTWQQATTPPVLGLGMCGIEADLTLNSWHLIVGPHHGSGSGKMSCWYLTGANTTTDIAIGIDGFGIGLGVMPAIHAKMLAAGVAFNLSPSDLYGNYVSVDAGIHVIEFGVRADLGLNLRSLTHAAIMIPASVMFTQGLGLDASINFARVSINPTSPEIAH